METNGLCLGCMAENGGVEICPYCGWKKNYTPESVLFLSPGSNLKGRYLMGRVLGYGGFGITYLAYDLSLRIKLAIKEYLPQSLATRSCGNKAISIYSGAARERFFAGLEKFISEARMLAKFNTHHCIVSVYGFFKENGTAYMVMEYVEGITFHEYLDRNGGKIDFNTALTLMTPVMEALREVHSVGIIHRDISPDNIYITRKNQVKLLDFGAARYADGAQNKSLSVLLKPGYAPWEQYQTRGKQGPWTDVYGVTATIYRAITGKTPPDAASRVDKDRMLLPSRLGVDLPSKMEAVLSRGLAVRPVDRYQSIGELQAALLGEDLPAGSDDGQVKQAAVLSLSANGFTVSREIALRRNSKKMVSVTAGTIGLGLIIATLVVPLPMKGVQSEKWAQTSSLTKNIPSALRQRIDYSLIMLDSKEKKKVPMTQKGLKDGVRSNQGPEQSRTTVSIDVPVIYVSPSGDDNNSGTGWQSPKQTIQAGIDAAGPGDEVWVAAGTYFENIVLKSGVKLKGSFAGNETEAAQRQTQRKTIIDGMNRTSVVRIQAGAEAAIIEGLTLRNGKAANGGGIYAMAGSKAEVLHCIIEQNSAGRGGGIGSDNNAHLVLEDCLITNNQAIENGGGVFLATGVSAKLNKCLVTENKAALSGGGIYCYESTVAIDTGDISANHAGLSGGGIGFIGGSYKITGNLIRNNRVGGNDQTGKLSGGGVDGRKAVSLYLTANDFNGNQVESAGGETNAGGGLCIRSVSTVVATNCRFRDNGVINHNNGYPFGGGIAITGLNTKALIHSCIIDGNFVECYPATRNTGNGGGIICSNYAELDLINCAIVKNSSSSHGGGLYSSGSCARMRVVNSIVTYNSTGFNVSDQARGRVSSSYNCFYGNSFYNLNGIDHGPGDFTADPQFKDYLNGDLSLNEGSPCIDAGDDEAVKPDWTDMAGNSRLRGAHVDIGAVEVL